MSGFKSSISEKESADEVLKYSSQEVEDILRLPKNEYILDSAQTKSALLGLVDIMFACLYDLRWVASTPHWVYIT